MRQSSRNRSEEHTSELQSPCNLVCRLLLEKKRRHAGTAAQGPPQPPRGRLPCTARRARGRLRSQRGARRAVLSGGDPLRFVVFFLKRRPPANLPPFPTRAPLPT